MTIREHDNEQFTSTENELHSLFAGMLQRDLHTNREENEHSNSVYKETLFIVDATIWDLA